jgi:hypothetical protein
VGESTKQYTKTPKSKKENSVSRTRKPDFSQSINSPIDNILFLQRTIGNQAVQRLIKDVRGPLSIVRGQIQAKLKIGQPNDIYEQEADRVAEQVMSMSEPPLQRQAEEDEDEEEIQTKLIPEQIPPLVQRQLIEEEDEQKETIQAKETSKNNSNTTLNLKSQIHSLRSGGQLLPQSICGFFESRFGQDFSHVRLHTDRKAAELAQNLNAKAFTIGRDVVFGAGHYTPQTNAGRRLLAHELTHVVQQQDYQNSTNKSDIQRGSKTGTLPAAIVAITESVVFQNPNRSSNRLNILKQNHPIDKVLKKKKVGNVWWYKIQYRIGSTTKSGWAHATDFTEIADPQTFSFETPGSTGFASPFQELREAVKKGKLNPKIARLINWMNFLLQKMRLELKDFTSKSFYNALISAKGHFEQASLLMTAAVRSFKRSTAGKFPWVQQRTGGLARFKFSGYRDKLWHFFWNAYKRFGGVSATTLKHLGLIYELKSRSNPITNFFLQVPLSRDATEDIVFNQGGVQFAEWIKRNERSIVTYHTVTIRNKMESAYKTDPEIKDKYKKLTEQQKKQLMQMAMMHKDVIIEIQKLSYTDYSKAAGLSVKIVLDAIKKLKP